MKITRLTSQKKNSERVNVFIDGQYCLSLTKDQLLNQKIFVNKEITKADLEIFLKLSDEGKLRSKTIEWLFIRPRSAKELKLYLDKKKVDSEARDKLINDMKTKKYQDDESFSSWWIDQRLSKNMSITKIKTELFSKGIDRTLVEETLDSKNINELENLSVFIEKKNLIHKYPETIKLKKYLFSKGYKYDAINEYFNRQN